MRMGPYVNVGVSFFVLFFISEETYLGTFVM